MTNSGLTALSPPDFVRTIELCHDLLINYREAAELQFQDGDLAAALELQHKGHALAERLAQGAQGDLEAQSDLARARAALGRSYRELARENTAPPERCVEHLLVARDWFQKSLAVWNYLQRQELLNKKYADQPDKIAGYIASCDEMLKRVRSTIAAKPK